MLKRIDAGGKVYWLNPANIVAVTAEPNSIGVCVVMLVTGLTMKFETAAGDLVRQLEAGSVVLQ